MPELIDIPDRGRLRIFGRGGHPSSYGLLGATAADEPINTSINLHPFTGAFSASLADKLDAVEFGPLDEYARAIVDAASVFAFPMTVRLAAHAAIGSSGLVFERLTDLLGPLVHVPEAERAAELVALWWERAWTAREWEFNVELPETYIDLRIDDPAASAERARLTAEIHREVGPGHRLLGRKIKVIAYDTAMDDVLIFVEPNRFALVHLTYTSGPPDRAPWPIATFVLDSAQLSEQWTLSS